MFKNIYIICLFAIGISTQSWAQSTDPCTASALPVNTTCVMTAGTVDGATLTPGITNCTAGGPQVFYTFVATDANMTVEVDGSSGFLDAVIQVFSGSCGALVSISCTDATGASGIETANLTGLTVGQTYTIMVYDYDGYSDSFTSFDICVVGATPSGGGSTPGGGLCADVEPICTDVGTSFTANATGTEAETLEPGNDYGCLSSSPDPAWYYLEIGVGGNIDMQLSAPNDVDFALWGPFTDLATAQASCGSLGAPIDCSYDPSNTEDVNISGGVVGEVYILVITNYDGSVQLVTLNQTGGTGATNCSAVCGVDAGTTTTTMSNSSSNDHYLCFGESVDISTTGEILPTATDIAGLGYFIYTDLPTVADPDVEPNWTGYYYTGAAITETNSVGNVYDFIIGNPSGSAGSNGIPSNNQLVFIPITMDDIANIAGGGSDDNLGHDIDDDGCYALGDPIVITYLNPIDDAAVETCGANVVVTLSGGYPEFVPGASYTVNSTGAGTMVQSGGQGQTLTFTGLNTGDVISVDVTDDGNGCTHTLTFTATCPTATPCAADTGNW